MAIVSKDLGRDISTNDPDRPTSELPVPGPGRANSLWAGRQSPTTQSVLLVVGTFVAVYLLGFASVRFAPSGSTVAAWWPAAGVAVGAMAVSVTWKQRAGVLLAIACASYLGNLEGGRPPGISLAFAVANLGDPIVAAAVFTDGWRRRPRLELADDLWRLFLGVCLGAAVTGALAGSMVALLQGGDGLLSARAVFASHATAVLVIVPCVFVLPEGIRPRRAAEILVQASLLVLTVALVFSGDQELPLTFLVIPLLLWGAVRFSARVVTVELLVAGAMTSILTSAGVGPFAQAATAEQISAGTTGTFLQLMLFTYTVVTLTLLLTTLSREASASSTETANALLESVLGAATDTLVVACDPEGRVEAFNAGAERLLGWSSAELTGRATPQRWHDQDEIRARSAAVGAPTTFELLIAPLRQGADSDRRDWTLVRRDGSRFTCSLRTSIRLSPRGAVLGYLLMGEDVSEVRRAEAVMKEALWREQRTVDRLQELERSKSALVANVSHELRTPMTSVIGYTDMLLDGDAGDLTPAQRRLAEPAARNGHRLMGLVEELLTMAQLDAGIQLNPVPTDLKIIAEHARETLQSALNDRDLTMSMLLPSGPILVLGDADHLERVVLNLLTNALKFTPDGGQVSLTLGRDDAEAHLEVSDTGIGIPAQEVDKIFDKFFGSSTTLESAIPGTGLGLSIVKDLVLAHGGTIRCRSAVGRGTTFLFVLPLLTSA